MLTASPGSHPLHPPHPLRALRALHQAAARSLRLWHLCSLDAPTVAVVWASLLARQCGSHLRLVPAAVLLLGAWLVYVLDRLFDAQTHRPAPPSHPARPILQDRHRFHHAHQGALVVLSGVAAFALSLLAAHLKPPLLHLYLALSLPVAVYAAAVHIPLLRLHPTHTTNNFLASPPTPASERIPSATLTPPPNAIPVHNLIPAPPFTASPDLTPTPGLLKEAAVALLFAAAVCAPAASRALPAQRPSLLLSTSLLALLCWLNCLLIAHSEAASGGLPHSRHALALATTTLATLAALAGATCLHLPAWRPAAAACSAVCLSAVALLALLAGAPGPARARRVRILADLALLTPLLVAFA